jgi:Ni,Fe-hydrogenase maturation factor
MMPTLPAPTLIIGYGNPSRGDDALGPALLEDIARLLPQHPEWGAIELLTDFQLQIEFVLDLAGRQRIIFADATVSCTEPFAFAPLTASSGNTAADPCADRRMPC